MMKSKMMAGGGKAKMMAAGGAMPMGADGKPTFASDGVGKMAKGGMTKMKAGGGVKSKMAPTGGKMGKVKTSPKRDGVAKKGLTKGKMVGMKGR
jgi:hypothetical protein